MHGFMSIEYWFLDSGREARCKLKVLRVHAVENAHCLPLLSLASADHTQLKGMDMITSALSALTAPSTHRCAEAVREPDDRTPERNRGGGS